MILVTGGTSFIGRAILRQLVEQGRRVRTLLGPSRQSPALPRGVPTEVALAAPLDERGIRAALVGVDTVIHADGTPVPGAPEARLAQEVEAARILAQAASQAHVRRLLLISHVGADRASALPLLRAKGLVEQAFEASGIPSIILRSGVLFGPGDGFTTSVAMLLAVSPLFLLPGDGSVLLQPLWVEDLATCVLWALDGSVSQGTFEIGGPEFLTMEEVAVLVMQAMHIRRPMVPFRQPYLRALAWVLSRALPQSPVSPLWLDYLAGNRIATLDALPQTFGLQPSRMETQLAYLKGRRWVWELLRMQLRRRNGGGG